MVLPTIDSLELSSLEFGSSDVPSVVKVREAPKLVVTLVAPSVEL